MSAALQHAKPVNSLGIARRPCDTRVVVAMSGGVDSSVVAGLLKGEGYDVVGITLQLYDHGAATHRKGACCAGQDIHDARRVAEQLAIPHYVLDYEKRFSEAVIGSFADSYLAGETPVPCIACNAQIKFKDLLETARELGADALATGHYVASRRGPAGYQLYQPADTERDQSYFLFATTAEQLSYLRFPLGGRRKADVRALAEAMAIPVARKSDSQDICFVPSGRYSDVIAKLRPGAVEPGQIVHVSGKVLGRHAGIINFTVGQRRGLGVTTGEPLFVVRLDAARREVVVGAKDDLRTGTILLREVNWLGDEPLDACAQDGLALFIRLRSSQQPQPATLLPMADGRARIVLQCHEHGVSPGQACVFYADGDGEARVLGGGWIERAAPVMREVG